MPPKKRKAPSTATATSAADDAPATRTRATRSAGNAEQPISKRAKTTGALTSKSKTGAAVETSPKDVPKRGRPAKAATATKLTEAGTTAVRKSGRPAKAASTVVEPDPATSEATTKKGRPAKIRAGSNDDTKAGPEPARKRGRPAKVVSVVAEGGEKPVLPPRKRGRPPKEVVTKPEPAIVSEPATQPKKKRGRPAKEQIVDEPQAKKPRGRPSAKTKVDDVADVNSGKSQGTGHREGKGTTVTSTTDGGADTDADATASAPSNAKSYWLMKAEPDSRVETAPSGKQVDLKFTIDDLKEKGGPEPWDGIRNHQAQKNLRTMKVGDLCFFAESNCKTPGLVGIMEVVGEARPDPAQFNRDSIYYDEKATEAKPRWNCVLVEFRRKFSQKLPTSILKTFAGTPSDPLHGMQLFRQTRLSVSKVESDEWVYVMKLVEQYESTMDEAADTKPHSAMGTGKRPGRKSAVTFAESTPTKPSDDKDATSDKKTPARYRKTPAKISSIPTDLPEEPVSDESELETEPVTMTPAPRKAGLAIPASEPKPAGKMTPATKAAAGAPATEPRPRGRPPGSKNKATLVTAATAAPKDLMGVDAVSETVKTPAPRRGRPEAAIAPASEPRQTTKATPGARTTGAPKTEPRPRGRPAKAQPIVNEARLSNETQASHTAITNVPQTEPRPRGRPRKTASDVESAAPKTEPRPRGRPPGFTNKSPKLAAPKSAAKGKRNPVAISVDEADTTLASLDRTPSKVAPYSSKEVINDSAASPTQTFTSDFYEGAATGFSDASATIAADVADAADEAGLDQGANGLQISIEEPTELTFATDLGAGTGEISWPDIQDVTGQSVGSAELLADAAEVTSPEEVMASTETPHRLRTPEHGNGGLEGETGLGVEEGKRGFFGRLGEGFVNVIASPGWAISRALSGTPVPEGETAVKGAERIDGLDVVEEEHELLAEDEDDGVSWGAGRGEI